MKTIITTHYASPAGKLILGAIDGKLCLCDWDERLHSERIFARLERYFKAAITQGVSPVLEQSKHQLDEYFQKKRTVFNIPLDTAGTDFQNKVWQALLTISYGQTTSYGQLAHILNKPKAVRAVANANGANALSIFIPCHRIIGSDGSLTGYAGGLNAKKILLNLERNING